MTLRHIDANSTATKPDRPSMEITNTHAESVIRNYIERYVAGNQAASIVRDRLDAAGIGLRPVLDHLSIRTLQVHERALELEALGYTFDGNIGVLERDTSWGKIYRKPGLPAIFIEQAYEDHRGAESVIPRWVERFSDASLHHIAISVDTIELAMRQLSEHGMRFSGEVNGEPGAAFRQIYTEPEIVEGEPFTTLEIVERRWGYAGLLPPLPSATR